MKSQCPECRTIWKYAMVRCEACGCQLTPADSRWKYRLSAIAVGLAVAVLQQVFQG